MRASLGLCRLAACGLLALCLLAGCGEGSQEPRPVAFTTAESAPGPVTVEGIPEAASIRQETGKPAEFTIREESSARQLSVEVPEDVVLPANLVSASYVVVTGTYDPQRRRFVASRIVTRVPTRDQQ